MKKLVCLLMATLLLVGLCFVLASCGECKHGEYATEYEIVDPTCTEDGKYIYTCLKCSEKVEVAPAADDTVMLKTGHTANKGEVTTAPTCTADGEKTFKCKTCDAALPEKTETVPALGHDVDAEAFVNDGTNHWNVCEREGCGAKVNETAHEMFFGQYSETHCAEVCDICLYVDEESMVAHAFDEGTETKAATCSKVGTKTYTCENCGYEHDEEISMTAHTYDTTKHVSDGENHWYACSACGAADETSVTPCSYGEATVTPPVAGSCAPGKSVETCTGCGFEKATAIPSDAAHKLANATFDGENTVSYTCTECASVFSVSGAGNLYDYETSATSVKSWTSVACWKNEVVEGADGNHYVSATVAEKIENPDAHYLQGPFKGMDSMTAFIMDFDVMADPEKGMCGDTGFACKGKDGWFNPNKILTLKADGSITGGDACTDELAPAGTVNGTSWTHVTIVCDLATGNVAYFINGTLAGSAEGSCLAGKTLTYINVIIPMATTDEQVGCGICLDNLVLATGDNAGVNLAVAETPAE